MEGGREGWGTVTENRQGHKSEEIDGGIISYFTVVVVVEL